jgi:RNA polymerase sigma factor (sigma-70 family)
VSELTDEALMSAYVAGDKKAFASLFGRLAPRVYGFFVRTFGSTTIADDLLQTTFLKLHRARAEYIPGAPVKPWLFTIAARIRLDELRRRYRLGERADEESYDEVLAPHAANDTPVEEALDRGALCLRVRAAVDRLPASQRVVVHLHRFEGLSFLQIAQILGTTEGAVKLRAFRAYERLRCELGSLALAEDAA